MRVYRTFHITCVHLPGHHPPPPIYTHLVLTGYLRGAPLDRQLHAGHQENATILLLDDVIPVAPSMM